MIQAIKTFNEAKRNSPDEQSTWLAIGKQQKEIPAHLISLALAEPGLDIANAEIMSKFRDLLKQELAAIIQNLTKRVESLAAKKHDTP